jgi:tellurite resistance protein TerC
MRRADPSWRFPVRAIDPALWLGFNAFIVLMLILDLLVLHRKDHEISVKEALLTSAAWIGLALAFDVVLYFWRGGEVALQFLSGYLIEKSLSVDNIFVFILVFAAFGVPKANQFRVLFWGVLGALIMRGALILAGSALLDRFHWLIYVFGAFLVVTGAKMAFGKESEPHPERNPFVRLARRFLPVTEGFEGGKFFSRLPNGVLAATPLFLVLLVIETTDLVFAVDSIPAIFAVTEDPFIVYSSNVFAILGLRALYFALAGVIGKFRYLKPALSAILAFVGVKMLLSSLVHIPTGISLAVIGGILAIAIVLSLAVGNKRA